MILKLLSMTVSGSLLICAILGLRALLQHRVHRNVGYKALLLLTAGVHWFNPLVWLMFYVAGQDLEMRADAEAVVALGGQRRSYAEALVSQEVQKLRGYLQTGFSYSGTGQRVKALARAKVRKGASIAAAWSFRTRSSGFATAHSSTRSFPRLSSKRASGTWNPIASTESITPP